MQIGMIGLGRMGMNMTKRLIKGRHSVVAYDREPERLQEAKQARARVASRIDEFASMLKPPRVVWLMIPAGRPVQETIESLKEVLQKGDIIIDGGNSFYKDDVRHAEDLQPYGIKYMGIGVSGGVWGLQEGYCLMAGGERETFDYIEPILKTLAPKEGYLYCGTSGAGHYVKMIHNAIEYGIIAAYGEGFELLDTSPYAGELDFGEVAHLWNQGSVIRSWLLELAESAFKKDPRLSSIEDYVEDSGEGRWSVEDAVQMGIPAPITALALFRRFRSRQEESFSDKFTAALRREFGGHAVREKEKQRKKTK